MKLNEAFPSNYLKATELKGKSVTVTIASVELVEMGQGHKKDQKLLLSFAGKDNQLVCNKTNAGTIEKLYGPETDDWVGQKITLAPREVEFQGEMVWSIRVSLTKPATASPGAKPAPKVAAPEPSDNDGDNVETDGPGF